MNAEELDAANEYRSKNWAGEPQMAEYLEKALGHIDQQAKQIKDLRRKKTHAHLLDQCNQRAATIETLKAALISERAYINSASTIKVAPMDNCFIGMAKQQLAQEFPAIFGEVKECAPET